MIGILTLSMILTIVEYVVVIIQLVKQLMVTLISPNSDYDKLVREFLNLDIEIGINELFKSIILSY